MTPEAQSKGHFSTNDSRTVSIGTDIVCVLLSATLLSIPLEDGGFWPFAFIALVPVLVRMWSRGYWTIFWFGFSTIFLYLFLGLQWVDEYDIIKGLPLWRIVLCTMKAVTYALAFVTFFYIKRKFNFHFFALLFPALLLLAEFKQATGFLALPWPNICHTQAKNLPLIQIASLTGAWGITFLLASVNEALAHLIAHRFKTKILSVAVVPVILVAFTGLYGALSLARPLPQADIEATVVQWDQATNREWTTEFVDTSMQAYSALTADALTPNPTTAGIIEEDENTESKRLVIWPETSIPHAVRSQYTMNSLKSLAQTYDATLLVGCLTQFPGTGQSIDYDTAWDFINEPKDYNSMVAFDPDGSVQAMYSKVHLVPFGEVIPMKNYIVNWFPEYPWGDTDASAGTGFYVTETGVGKIGAVICYESFFPQVVRQVCLNGAEILVLGSNTSWFGRTRASYHHARFDVFRAIENRTWFCRAATTGISSFIDPHGRTYKETELFKSKTATMNVGRRTETTFYTRHGDWLPALSGLFVALLLLGTFLIKKSD